MPVDVEVKKKKDGESRLTYNFFSREEITEAKLIF